MRRQARRLWFGEWQHDEEPTDTFVIVPEDEEDAEAPADPQRNVRRGAIVVAIGLVIGVVFALSSGADDKQVTSERSLVAPAQAPQAQPQPQIPQTQIPQTPQRPPPQGFGRPDLTGAAAEKAAQAALAKYPGSIERVTRDGIGDGYVVHVIQPDGNEVHVLVDGTFQVQGSDADGPPRNLGPGTSQ